MLHVDITCVSHCSKQDNSAAPAARASPSPKVSPARSGDRFARKFPDISDTVINCKSHSLCLSRSFCMRLPLSFLFMLNHVENIEILDRDILRQLARL